MQSSKEQQRKIRKLSSVQRNRGRQQNGKDQRSLQANQRYQGNISCKDEHNKGQIMVWTYQKQKILRRGGKNTQKNYTKKDLCDPDNHDSVITNLEPDILEWEVKRALGTITMKKLEEVMEFQLSYFTSQKMMLCKCSTQYASKFGKLISGHRTGKGQFSFQSQRKAMPKNVQTTAQLHSSHTLAK